MRHVVNHQQFTDRLALLARREPDHIKHYILTVVRKHFLKNWERTEKIESAPRGVPVFHGLRDKDGNKRGAAIPFVIQTANGPEATSIFTDDPLYEQVKNGGAVFINMEFMAELQNEIRDVLDWMRITYTQPKDLSMMAFVDAQRKAKEWHEAEERKRERQNKRVLEELMRKAELGAMPLFEIECSFQTNPRKKWLIMNLTTASSLEYEGMRQHHCVADYAPAVLRGDTLIWSLRTSPLDPALTLQISPYDRNLYQARGLLNSNPTHEEIVVLNALAKTAGLKLELFPQIRSPLFEHTSTVNVKQLSELPRWKE
jgi:hypothetical protein